MPNHVRRLRDVVSHVRCEHAAAAAAAPALSAGEMFAHDPAGASLTGAAPLRGYPYLTDSDSEGMPVNLKSCSSTMPMVWEARPGNAADAHAAASAMRALIDSELSTAGAMLFRGLGATFGISGAPEFAQLTDDLAYDLFECVPLASLRHVPAVTPYFPDTS